MTTGAFPEFEIGDDDTVPLFSNATTRELPALSEDEIARTEREQQSAPPPIDWGFLSRHPFPRQRPDRSPTMLDQLCDDYNKDK